MQEKWGDNEPESQEYSSGLCRGQAEVVDVWQGSQRNGSAAELFQVEHAGLLKVTRSLDDASSMI